MAKVDNCIIELNKTSTAKLAIYYSYVHRIKLEREKERGENKRNRLRYQKKGKVSPFLNSL